VQHRLKERAKEINELLGQKAFFYVCGDAANMAREVNAVLAQIIASERGIPEAKAEEIVKQMRSSNQYQVRFVPVSSFYLRVLLTPRRRRTCGRKDNPVLSISHLRRSGVLLAYDHNQYARDMGWLAGWYWRWGLGISYLHFRFASSGCIYWE
jgi:hypothetical protein